MNEKVFATLKSTETEDWVDCHLVRPFSYLWACLFARLGIHPNTVTVISMIVGAGSCVFFARGSYYYEGMVGLYCNLIAVVLLLFADVLDCTDGQLARMTGKKSRLGRILDGVAGFVWFTPIYLALVYRFYLHHDIEFSWLGIADTEQNALIATVVVFVLGLVSGIVGLAGQQRLADYYIQIHLLFQKGEKGCELDNSVQQQEIYKQMPWKPWKENLVWKIFQYSYVGYTQKQERVTPKFQQLMSVLRKKYGSVGEIPQDVREEFHRRSCVLMKFNDLLTFNFRSAWLFLFCLLDIPVGNFLFEIIIMSMIANYVNRRHERLCQQITQKL